MKIKQEHLEELKKHIDTYLAPKGRRELLINLYQKGLFSRAGHVKDLQKRFCFDIYYASKVPRELVKAMYDSGMNDDHIYTALRSILPTIERNY